MSQTITDKLDRCLGKRSLLHLTLGRSSSPKRPCTKAARAASSTMNSTTTPQVEPSQAGGSSSQEGDAHSWDTNLLPQLPFPPSSQSSDESRLVPNPCYPLWYTMQEKGDGANS